jgi:hypothetical protein
VGNKPIKQSNWTNLGIKYVQDLLDNDGNMATIAHIEQKLHINIPIMKYNSLISAIPLRWKKLIKADNNCLNYYVFTEHKIAIGQHTKKIEEVKTKELYWAFVVDKAERPTSEKKWEEEVGLGYDEKDWTNVYIGPTELTRDTKILMLQYKINHRILACKHKLHIWKIEKDSICNICKTDVDCIEHHLVACPKTLQFWDTCFRWFKAMVKVSFPIDTYDIIFGIANPNNDMIITNLNYIILYGKYYIYLTKQKGKELELYNFLILCKNALQQKQLSMIIMEKENKFKKTWEELLEHF